MPGSTTLTWQQARRSLAERAFLIPHRDIEVTVIAREPHQQDIVQVFVDGTFVDLADSVTVRTELFYLDPDDDDDGHRVCEGMRRAATLSPLAAAMVADVLRQFACDNRIGAGDDHE